MGSIRRECLDHIVIFNKRHLRRVLSWYVDYYQSTRTHLALDKNWPRLTPGNATRDREGRRNPASRRPTSPLRTSPPDSPQPLLTNVVACSQNAGRLRISIEARSSRTRVGHFLSSARSPFHTVASIS